MTSDDSQDSSPKQSSIAHSFVCAAEGIRYAITHERNMRIHCCIAFVAIIAGFALGINASSWLAVIICIGMVMSLECFNTALERLTDVASPQIHPLAKAAKDCAAGGVLIAAIASVIVGCIVYIPPILALVN